MRGWMDILDRKTIFGVIFVNRLGIMIEQKNSNDKERPRDLLCANAVIE